jgi:hypothetical protein
MSASFIPRWTFPLLLVVGAAAATAQEAPPPPAEVPADRPAIHFADFGGIRNWRADDDKVLFIEARNDKWYKATFFGPCWGLRSAVQIGFVSDVGSSIDRYGSIVVRRPGSGTVECHFRTFEELPGPPPRKQPRPVGDEDEKK